MITKLNLSTHPFRNRNLPYLLTVLMIGIGVAGAAYCFRTLGLNASADENYRVQISQMGGEIKNLKDEGLKVKQQLSPDQQALVVAAHKLVDNKNFVWSRLFSDLENVLPASVSASRIALKDVSSDSGQVRADLDFAVISRDYAPVREMIDSMNNSGLFEAEIKSQDLQKTETVTYTEYTLHLIYTPTYRTTDTPVVDVAQNNTGGAQ